MELIRRELKSVINGGTYKRSDNLRILEEFADSGLECAEVKNFSQKNAEVCASSLANSIKHYGFSGIAAISRKDHVYLIRAIGSPKKNNRVDNVKKAYGVLVRAMDNEDNATIEDFTEAIEKAISYLNQELAD